MKQYEPIGSTDLIDELLLTAREQAGGIGPRMALWIGAEAAAALTQGAVRRFVALDVEPTSRFVELISENGVYQVNPHSAANHYLLHYTQKGPIIGYQHILGSRELAQPSDQVRHALALKLCEVVGVVMPERAATVTPISDEPEPALKRELRMLRAEGHTIYLPKEQLHEYPQIKKLIEKAGGKYKRGTFVFAGDTLAQDVLDALIGGEKLDPQKEWQFFTSPASVADDLLDEVGPLEGKSILEPSAGEGAIAKRALARGAAEVVAIEAWSAKAAILRRGGAFSVIERDFLTVTPAEIGLFDAVVANPPFTGNQDIEHVMHMLKFLAPGGKLSSVMSVSWQHGQQRKHQAFREFLAEVGAKIVQIPAGTFKASGTTVATVRIVIEADRVASSSALRVAA